MIVVQLIPGALLGIGSLILPPSPRYLVSLGDDHTAENVLMKLRRASDGLENLVQVRVV